MCIWDSYGYQRVVPCFLIHKLHVRSIKRYGFVRKYAAIPVRQAFPLKPWSGPEGSRKLRFPDSMTTAQDGGKVVSLTHRPPLPP